MPIKIPDNLPAKQELEQEGLPVMNESDAVRQDIRPLRFALLNLMPQKEKTETQLARLLGSTPLQVELTLLTTASYVPKNVPVRHMRDFYKTWDEVAQEKFDGLVITGAPIEKLPFEDVIYWKELTKIIDWSQTNVNQTLDLCWAAQAALYHFYGVPKYDLPKKMFGVYEHRIMTKNASLLRGFNDDFLVPVSRHTEVRREDIPQTPGIEILAESPDAGLCLVQDHAKRHIYMFNHLEYDALTLRDEYERDVAAGDEIQVPRNYFPDDDPALRPRNMWRAYAHLLISNWINEIYQHTPYHVDDIGKEDAPARQAGE